jgi:hypothetical protein
VQPYLAGAFLSPHQESRRHPPRRLRRRPPTHCWQGSPPLH